MRWIVVLGLFVAACASTPAAAPETQQVEASAPTTITLENKYWGNTTSMWTVRRGEGEYVDPQRTVRFPISDEIFARVRAQLRPYENRDFQCRRVITDGPYGTISWFSGEGEPDRRTQWDAGCVSGDADDLFARLDAVGAILEPFRDAAAQPH